MPPKRCITFMKNIISISLFILILQVTLSAGETNHFTDLKRQLNEAGCINLEFISSLESSVFDTVDSTYGMAVISGDGCYNIRLGNDIYLYDHDKSYSYSEGANQVIIEDVDDPEMMGKELSFIKNLDELYTTNQIKKNRIYMLSKIEKEGEISDIPDSMIMYISDNNHFDSLSYYDINEDLNKIYFISQIISDTCDNSLFIPNFPDSAERVRF